MMASLPAIMTRGASPAVWMARWPGGAVGHAVDCGLSQIEAQSGIRFHYRSGGVQVGFTTIDPNSNLNKAERNALYLGTAYEKYSSQAFARPTMKCEQP